MSSYNFQNEGSVAIIDQVLRDVNIKIINDNKPKPICFGLNEPDPKFTGRTSELRQLEDAINDQTGHNTFAVVVCGLGGIGKTQLLRKFIAQKKLQPTPAYYHFVWIDSESTSLMLNAFTELADDLSIKFDKSNPNLQLLVSKVLNCLSSSPTAIVFDNIDDGENKKFLKIVLTTAVSGSRPHVFITSRIKNWSSSARLIQLEGFNSQDALEYVTQELMDADNVHNDSVEALALVETLQYFPLALAQAVAHINHHRRLGEFYISDYLHEYQSQVEKALSSNFLQIDDEEYNLYNQTTLTIWKVTIAAVNNNETFGNLAIKILRIISYFNPDHILRNILFQLPDDESDVTQAVDLLVNYSMLNSQRHQSVLSIHRLVQQVTKIELKRDQGGNKSILQNCLELISKMKDHREFEKCLEHGISVFVAVLDTEDLVHQYKTFPSMILCSLNHFRQFHRTITFGEEIMQRMTSVLGEMDTDILNCKSSTAIAHRTMRNMSKSLPIDEEVFEKRREVLGEDDRDTLISKSNVALVYAFKGKNDEALKMHEEVIKVLKNLENTQDVQLQILESKSHIAILYNKIGQVTKSITICREVYEQRKSILGDDHSATVKSLYDIGVTHGRMGKHSDALRIHQKVYEKRKAIGFSEEDTGAVFSKNAIAHAYSGIGKSSKSLEIYEKLYELWKNIYGHHHTFTLDLMYNIGVQYNILGRQDDALRLHKEVYRERSNYFEENSLQMIEWEMLIAETHRLFGKYSEALQAFEDIYDRAQMSLGEKFFITLRCKCFVALCYRNVGDYREALRIYEETFQKRKTILDRDYLDYGDNEFEIANTYNHLGNYNKALELHQKILEKRKAAFGNQTDTSPRILDSKSKIAETYNNLGKYAEALALHQEVLEERKTLSEEIHPLTFEYKSNVADSFSNIGEHSKAYRIYQEVYDQRKSLIGENHPHTLDSKFRIAISQSKLGELNLALQMHREVYQQRQIILGDSHPHTLDSKFCIAVSLNDLKKYSTARQMHQEVYQQRQNILGESHPHTRNSKLHIDITSNNL